MKLQRHPYPVMPPDPTADWETYNVFNPAVIHHNGLSIEGLTVGAVKG